MIWLRAECKKFERRTPLTPQAASQLINRGIQVYVEKSPTRIFPDDEYCSAGCELVEGGSWKQAPLDAYILGLKELPSDQTPLVHKHIYFAHAYKGQSDAREILSRFHEGGGEIYDLEFLTDEKGRRVSAFGHWAGFVGTALSIDFFYQQQKSDTYPSLKDFSSQESLLEQIRYKQSSCSVHPRVILIGALGRCGRGAVEMAEKLQLEVTKWDYEETKRGGPFEEIAEHEIFINTVLLSSKIPPFIDRKTLNKGHRLRVIGDVSCDPSSPYNPIPLYDHVSNWKDPFISVVDVKNPLDILAVDNLPSLLPKESSEDFSQQLLPHLQNFLENRNNPVWQRSREHFAKNIEAL
mgnify:CR=1 FL=1